MMVTDEYTERFERDLARARKFLSEIEGLGDSEKDRVKAADYQFADALGALVAAALETGGPDRDIAGSATAIGESLMVKHPRQAAKEAVRNVFSCHIAAMYRPDRK